MKRLSVFLACGVLSVLLVGCGAMDEAAKTPAGGLVTEATGSVAALSSQDATTTPSTSTQTTPSTSATERQQEPSTTTARPQKTSATIAEKTTKVSSSATQKIQKKNTVISKEAAKAAALKYAGVAAKDVSRYEIELDYDDDTRRWEYEISFYVGREEYELTLDAVTGTVLEYEKDRD